ncbi:hypothetical protein OF83DRAFT_1068002, partial [Amylostereum chailletii]
EVYDILAILPWHGAMCGFDNPEPTYKLATYITPHAWLSDVHEDQMLELLQQDIVSHRAHIELENLNFMTKMKRAYHDQSHYMSHREFLRLRGVGSALAEGRQRAVGMVVHVMDCHWVALAIDFVRSEILYGDPKGWAPDTEVMEAAQWWASHHGQKPFTFQHLESSHQQDNHNCGLLTFNSLAQFCLPDKYPLLDIQKLDDERLAMMLRVARHHLDAAEVSNCSNTDQFSYAYYLTGFCHHLRQIFIHLHSTCVRDHASGGEG